MKEMLKMLDFLMNCLILNQLEKAEAWVEKQNHCKEVPMHALHSRVFLCNEYRI